MNAYMPTYPELLQAAFAMAGDKAAIPLLPTVQGRASLADGFPIVTSQPIEAGGIPPDRLDFNGILNQLSQYAFWQQSGGHFYWSALLNYAVPTLLFASNSKIYLALQPSGPAVAGVGAKDPADSASNEFWLDYAASITPPVTDKYDIAQYSWFEDDMPRDGFFSCLGGVVTNFAEKYPLAAAYFETSYGQKRLVTQAEYEALHVYSWYTSSDGIKVGWNGIGGVAKFVWDKQADTLRLPDLAGMTPEQVGFSDSLGVGGGRGDQMRNITGMIGGRTSDDGAASLGAFRNIWVGNAHQEGGGGVMRTSFDASRVVPTGPRNHGPRWVSDARVYLGQPTS